MATTGTYNDEVTSTIRAELARRRSSQTQLATVLGMHEVTMSRRMNGKADWTLTELESVARFFGMSLGELLGAQRAS